MAQWTKARLKGAAAGAFLSALVGWSGADARDFQFSWPIDIGPVNPHQYEPNAFFAQDMIYEPLVSYGAGGVLEPALAERWSISEDGRVLTFHLRRGVVFSDGTPFDAKAVQRNFDEILAQRGEHDWLALVGMIEKTEAAEPHLFRIVLKAAYYPALQELALIRPVRVLAPSAFPDNGPTSAGIKAPIGTGPWVLAEHRKDDVAVFARNERYWGGKPAIERVVVKTVADGNARSLAFQRGDIDLIFGDNQISLHEFKRLRGNPRYKAYMSEPLFTRMMVLNAKSGPTRDLNVRQAIQFAFNRDATVQYVLHGVERPADALFPPSVPYAGLQPRAPGYAPDKARALLDEAGWRAAKDGAVRERSGERLILDIAFANDQPLNRAIAQALQADLQAVGVELVLRGEAEADNWKRANNGEFHLAMAATWGPPYDPHTYVSGMRQIVEGHPDYQAQLGLPMKAEMDATITRLMAEPDEGKRREMYRSVFDTLAAQAVYLPVSYGLNVAVVQQGVDGFAFSPQQNSILLHLLKVR